MCLFLGVMLRPPLRTADFVRSPDASSGEATGGCRPSASIAVARRDGRLEKFWRLSMIGGETADLAMDGAELS
jgi:hypothetical protein